MNSTQSSKPISSYRQSLKERILETAMNSFAERGIKAVKMDDIANSLSVSKRTLYEIYTNKEDLLFEGIKQFHRQKREELKRILDESSNVMDVILAVYRQKAEEFRQTNPVLYADIVKYPRIVRYLEENKNQNHDQFYGFMQRGVEEGYFRKDVNYEIISHMFEALSSYMFSERLYQKYSFEDLFLNLLFVTLRGFCTNKGIEKLDTFIEHA